MQILLPLYDNDGKPFDQSDFLRVRNELTERFGGITAYFRSPATGLWKESEGKTVQDDIVIYEVMVGQIDRDWWRAYRQELAVRFHQEQLIVRALPIELL